MTAQPSLIKIRLLHENDHAEWLRLRETLWPVQSAAEQQEDGDLDQPRA